MIDRDLAELYGVETRILNQAVKRNKERFPEDFMFRLTLKGFNEVVTICDNLMSLKYAPIIPLAFTEQGVAMLSSVLKSRRAIEVNITIMRAFVRLKEMAFSYEKLAELIKDLERRYDGHDEKIGEIFRLIDKLSEDDGEDKGKGEIGFKIS